MCPDLFGLLVAVFSSWSTATTMPPAPPPKPQPVAMHRGESPEPPIAAAQARPTPTKPPSVGDKLPITGLAPAKIRSNQCLLTYRISTHSKDCQAHFDQGLGYLYSYVWMEAARSFETAARCDPTCPMAWWGLCRAQEEWRGSVKESLKKAQELLGNASDRERSLITARLQLKGLIDTLKTDADRRKAAVKTLDLLLALHDDDQEAWFARARLAGDGTFGFWSSEARTAEVPFHKALLKVNPLHPGANHELVHIYEAVHRPALGYPHAEKYIESSPGIPHAWHMQAHLAMRLGRWDQTTDRSTRAIELQRQYHQEMAIKPREDHQHDHHMETLLRALIHDGRFREARALKAEAKAIGYRHTDLWFRLHLAERDWPEAWNLLEEYRKRDKTTAAYYAALYHLHRNEPDKAEPEVKSLGEAQEKRKSDKQLERRLNETKGWLMCCQCCRADEGLKLLEAIVKQTKNNYDQHAWGHGAYYMEVWGHAAMCAGRLDVAEEAFLEALAHDPGSAHAAMGLHVLCQRQGRGDEAVRYAALARRCWRNAEVRSFDALLETCGGKTAE